MKGSKLMPKLEIPGEKHIIGQQEALGTGHEIAIRVAQSKALRIMEDFRVTFQRVAMAGWPWRGNRRRNRINPGGSR